MSERDITKELLEEIKASRPEIEGYEYLSEDPIGNLTYTNDGKDGQPLGSSYKVLLGGNPETAQDFKFHFGNPNQGVVGITNEALIDIAIDRIIKQNDQVADWHNNLAVDGLTLAANVLNKRNLDRESAGVLHTDKSLPRVGTNEFHPIVRRLLTNQERFNFIVLMMSALSESFDQITDKTVQKEFIEIKPEGPLRLIQTTPAEEEAITISAGNSQKLLAVLEQTELFQTIFGTIVHGKKLNASTQQPTTPTSPENEVSNDSIQGQI